MKKEYIIGGAILLMGIVIAFGQITVQNNKQSSIEKQLEMKLEQENLVLEEQQRVSKKQELAELLKRTKLSGCMDSADEEYWDFMRLNGTEKEDGTIWAETRDWNTAKNNKESKMDFCIKMYK